MDKETQRTQLEAEKNELRGYLEHPFTKQIFADSAESQEALIELLCQQPIINIETFFAHFEAIGHLRGLRRAKALITGNLEDIEQQLKELN